MQDDFEALVARGNALFHVDIPTESAAVHTAINEQRVDSNQAHALHAKQTSRRTAKGSGSTKRPAKDASPRRRAAKRPQTSADHVSGFTDPSVAEEAAALIARRAYEAMLEDAGDDEEARQELLALSSTMESFHNSKRRRFAQQRAKEVQALDNGLQSAVQHVKEEAEKAKENTSSAIREDAARVWADMKAMLQEFEQVRARMLHQLRHKHAEVEAACKQKLKDIQQATTDKHRGLQQELAGLVQDLKHTCNTLVDSSTKRLERIAEQESAHLRKYQRALTLMTNQATEAQL